MEKVTLIVKMLGGVALFLAAGILGTFYQDKTWELLERWRRVIGDGTEYKRTPAWNTSTRVGGIIFLALAIVFFGMTIFVFIFPY